MWPLTDDSCGPNQVYSKSFIQLEPHNHIQASSTDTQSCYQVAYTCPSSLPESGQNYSLSPQKYVEPFSSYSSDGCQNNDHYRCYPHENHHHHIHHHQSCQFGFTHQQLQSPHIGWNCETENRQQHCDHTPSNSRYEIHSNQTSRECSIDSLPSIPSAPSEIYDEISKECEHFLKTDDCDKCKIRHADGNEESIPIEDLVDIVYQAAKNIKENDSAPG
ncbi:unnamed protein product [Caenorhabditis auriculariae]|uniref:Uncharacterized protein n=1 Tax=Caenorhabditis auriculariae TaxID=2777116 RepID=A0A8S1HN05_9PELO|nr:unnamed protein product [Caenorhabditis auriculariae]